LTSINKKKIAVICPGFGIIPRGIETVVKEIFFRIAKSKNYEIDIFCAGKIPNKPKNINIINIKMPKLLPSFFPKLYSKITKKIKFPFNENFDYNFMIFSFFLLKKIFKKKYDVIFNNGGYFSGLICKLYRLIYKTPFIHSGHAGINKLEFLLAKQNPDFYIASTNPAETWIKKFFPLLKTSTIPNGIDSNIFFPNNNFKQNKIFPKNLNHPIYLFVGALTKQKQPDKLLEIFLENNIGTLIIIGDGPLKNKILKLSNNKKNIIYKNFVEYNNLPLYFNKCDVFVLPSQNETFGIVYIMALACNKPIIAEDNIIQKSIIKNAGLYYKNIPDLKEKLIKINEINFKNIPLEISKNFYWSKIKKQYIEIIEKITNKK